MPRGRFWSADEDEAIRRAVRDTFADGGGGGRGDFEQVADAIGRSLHAVRKRAQRLGVKVYRSYHRHGLYARRPEAPPANQAELNQANQPDADASPDEARRILHQIRRVTG